MRKRTMLGMAFAIILGLAPLASAPSRAMAQEGEASGSAGARESYATTELWIRGPRPEEDDTPSDEGPTDDTPPADDGETDSPDEVRRDFPSDEEPSKGTAQESWQTKSAALAKTGDPTDARTGAYALCAGAVLVLLSRVKARHLIEEECNA